MYLFIRLFQLNRIGRKQNLKELPCYCHFMFESVKVLVIQLNTGKVSCICTPNSASIWVLAWLIMRALTTSLSLGDFRNTSGHFWFSFWIWRELQWGFQEHLYHFNPLKISKADEILNLGVWFMYGYYIIFSSFSIWNIS